MIGSRTAAAVHLRLDGSDPQNFLIWIPFVSIGWLGGVEITTKGKISGGIAFLPAWLLGTIGSVIVQDGFNQADSGRSLTV